MKNEVKACANCKYYKRALFGKKHCTAHKVRTCADQLCYAYVKKEKK